MFDRFTDNARRVCGFARVAAQTHAHDYIGPEHLLLGILDCEGCFALAVLDAIVGDPAEIEAQVLKRIKRGKAWDAMGNLPFTEPAKNTLKIALEESDADDGTRLGSEHLLLGLLGGDQDAAAEALGAAGVTRSAVREQIAALPGQAGDGSSPARRRSIRSLREEHEALRARVEELEARVARLERGE